MDSNPGPANSGPARSTTSPHNPNSWMMPHIPSFPQPLGSQNYNYHCPYFCQVGTEAQGTQSHITGQYEDLSPGTADQSIQPWDSLSHRNLSSAWKG